MLIQGIKNLIRNKSLTSSGFFIFALMFANGMNFLFNAILGRALSFENFGVLTLITSLWYLISIPLISLAGTANYMIAHVNAESNKNSSDSFFKNLRSKTTVILGVCGIVWLLLSRQIAHFFQLSDVFPIATLSTLIFFGGLTFLNRAYLQGNFFFKAVGITLIIESVVKLVAAIGLVSGGAKNLVYLSIPFSLVIAFIFTGFLLPNKLKIAETKTKHTFPRKFYFMALLSSLASTAFLIFDVILVKHFLDPNEAGIYALLSLVGKMVYFFGSLLNGIAFTYISQESGKRINNKSVFYKILFVSVLLTLAAFILVGPFGYLLLPLLLGTKVLEILPYLTVYSLAMGLYTICGLFVSYHLVHKQYSFAFISVCSAAIMCISIILFHASIMQISYSILNISAASLLIIIVRHILVKRKTYE